MGKRLTIEQIRTLYPQQYVGLIDVQNKKNSNCIDSAVVKYTTKDISFDELSLKAIFGEVFMIYTTPEDDPFMNLVEGKNA